ncbi:phage antirepressor [Alicyclobacillus sp. ALC3]|uniref:phage antirepressor n=1 Tax=Alicyclobacillus sp. ALC3 TaxID=2796143 RepID=UPI002379E1BE|nr:phage antirepressor KilAC domain-containing protein [Alicyclobacillus sp. ALC3]
MSNQTALELFQFENRDVRVVSIDGEPWFVAKDVCDVLGLSNMRSSLALLDDDEKGVHTMDTLGGKQQVSVVNEPGLYSLILRSRKDEAKRFKRWITHEVIPQIRKTGSYGAPRMLSRLELIDLARESELARLEAEQRNAELQHQLRLQEPKVIFADAVSVSANTILIRELAVVLKQNGIDTGEKRLFDWLRNHGYLVKRAGTDRNTPTQRAMELGLFEVKETPVVHSDGYTTVSKTTKVTGKGQLYFVRKFLAEQAKRLVEV